MRKETWAGIIAGIISGLLVGAIFSGQAAWSTWNFFETPVRIPLTNRNVTTGPTDYTFALTAALYSFFNALSNSVFLGAIIGFLFGVAVNKLPIRSTYVKAIIVAAILWLVYTVATVPTTTSWSISAGYHVERSWSWSSLPFLPLFVLDGLAFAYLFNRWTR